ncbi:MAG: hypothetical protein K9L74_07275, partial [Candidatus Izimaplasma sp.]|nr:hypothetical protein [Candidatus Izimaplasma bacterium]
KTTGKNQHDKLLYVRNDHIIAAELKLIKFRCIRFLIFLVIGLVGGIGHYLYQTLESNYSPDLPISLIIIGVFSIVGLIVSLFRKRQLRIITKTADLSQKKIFTLPIDKDVEEKELEDLIYILVS